MAKYMIHTSVKRLNYVENFLIPSMIEQGICKDDITVYLDENREGNLKSCIKSFQSLSKEGGTWHLQDDIILSSKFKTITELGDKGISCGFCNIYSKDMAQGFRPVKDMWYSFPCIRIPNNIAHEFVDWFNTSAVQIKYKAYIADNKFDDSLFRFFMLERHGDMYVYNIAPNIVDNIDYLIGGSLINYQRTQSDVNSLYFNEDERKEMLKWKLQNSVYNHK